MNNKYKGKQSQDKPQRRKRVRVDRDTEVVIASNTNMRIIYDDRRMTTNLDMGRKGDEEVVTVNDLRVMLNSNRKMLEGFEIVIIDVLSDDYELEDVLTFLGLDKAYKQYNLMNPDWKHGEVSAKDTENFILKSNPKRFKEVLKEMDKRAIKNIIATSIVLFKLGEFNDYSKMQTIREYTNDDIFLDAEITQVDSNVRAL